MHAQIFRIGCLLLAIAVGGFTQLLADSRVLVYLELSGPSLFESQYPETTTTSVSATGGGKAAPASVPISIPSPILASKRRLTEIRAEQDAVELAVIPLQAQVVGRLSRLVNALQVLVPESQISALSKVPGVVRVQRSHLYRPSVSASVSWIGAPSVWAPPVGRTGEGVRIGIIDSGIDYTHADFGGSGGTAAYDNNDATVLEPGTFPTAKVVGGTDLVGDDYDAGGVHGSTVPKPDPDPLDSRGHGHGSHVAGIAAGFGVSSSGETYSGPYDTSIDVSQFRISPGVAPKALLYAIKVFGGDIHGTSGVVPQGLDWAADPDQTGDLTHRLDVANLSLGTDFGDDNPSDVEIKAVDRLARLGCVVVIAAGNDGNTAYIAGNPGLAARAITVANSNDGFTGAVRVNSPASVAGLYSAVEGSFTAQLSDVGDVTGQLVAANPVDACGTLLNASALNGKIALINRGTCLFTEKIQRVVDAGAIGVVMVNNVDGPSIVMGATDSTTALIPGVMISQADGAALRAKLGGGVQLTLSASLHARDLLVADQLDPSSSRGPVYRSNRLKPDVAAPGVAIHSARAGSASEGVTYSGTSMACPQVSGAAALVRQAHADWPVEDIKAALMNTAVRTRDGNKNLYPESRTGAGRIQVDQAISVPVVVRAVASDGRVSVAYGARELTAPVSIVRTVALTNHGDQPVSFQIASSNTVVDTGIAVTSSVPSITVAAHDSASVDLVYVADPARFTRRFDASSPTNLSGVLRQPIPESTGEVWFHSPGFSLHIPWHSVARAASELKTTVSRVGVPAGDTVDVTLPIRGTSVVGTPIVSVFQLGTTLANGNYSDLRSSTDLLAVGAASDLGRLRSTTAARVHFALVTAGSWLSPNRGEIDLDIEIDLNGDSRADYTIINANSGTYAAGDVDAYTSSTDALETVVRKENSPSTALIAETTFNSISPLAPEFPDTAPFLNGVLIHTVQAKDIGLTSSQTKFRYRVLTRGEFSDTSSWVTFDAAAPVVDGTAYATGRTPFRADGTSVRFQVNRSVASAAGFTAANPPRALVIHQHNGAGKHHEVVVLDLSTPDSDGDGLPDAWELATFGDLSHDGTTDADQDGVSDLDEYLAGTDPLDPASPFRVTRVLPAAVGAGLSIEWPAKVGQTFSVERAAAVGGPFVPVATRLTATPPLNAFTDPAPAATGTQFYRVRIE